MLGNDLGEDDAIRASLACAWPPPVPLIATTLPAARPATRPWDARWWHTHRGSSGAFAADV